MGTSGVLAAAAGYHLPNCVLRSAAGFYIGTANDDGPVSRESAEYYATYGSALHALTTHSWTQRTHP